MKIGVMLRHINERGGIVVYTKNLIENLLAIDGSNQYVFIYGNDTSLGSYPGHPNVKEIIVRAPNKLIWDQYCVPKIIRQEGIDLIFNPKLSVPLFSPVNSILTMHGLEQFAVPHIFKKMDRIYFTMMMPFYCRRARAIISMTDTGKRDLVRYLNVRPGKIFVINESHNKRFRIINDSAFLLDIRKKYNLPEKYALFVGGLTPLKNFSNILRAIKYLKEMSGVRIKLVSIGFKRWKYEKDLELISSLGLNDDVLLLGFIPDEEMPALYNSATCFVFPSLYEGFGIPVPESQACGCPVIVSNTGALPEVSGGAGLLINPNDYKDIANAIHRIFTDKGLRKELINKGLENAGRFSWERCARETLALFNKVYEG